MLLASCGTEIKFHKWPSGDYYGSYQIPEAGFSIPNMSWCSEGELLATTVPSLGPPIIISVENSGIQTYQHVDIPQIQAAAFSWTDKKNLACGTEGGQVLIYDLSQKNTIGRLAALPSAVRFLEYGARDLTLAAGCKNGQICLYNSKRTVSASFYVPNCNNLSAMACHAKLPNRLGAASIEGIVVVWDTTTGSVEFLDKSHNASTTDMAFSSENILASVGLDEKFIGYDLKSRECLFCCKTHDQLSAVEFVPGSTQICIGTIDGKLVFYDTRSINHPLHTIIAHHPKAVRRIAFQNIPSVEDPNGNEPQKLETPKSTLMMVYNKPHLVSATSLIQQASTVNTIIPDIPSDISTHKSEGIVPYLRNIQFENRGDAFNFTEFGNLTPRNSILNRSPFPVELQNLDEDDAMVKNDSINNWIRKIKSYSCMTNMNVLMDQDEDITKLRQELQDVTKEAIELLTETINREFLKVRMAISRGFVKLESKMDARWAEFNNALVKTTRGSISDDLLTPKELKENSAIQFPSIRRSTRSHGNL